MNFLSRMFFYFSLPGKKVQPLSPSPSSPLSPTKRGQLSNFLIVYFNFAFYLFCSPFHFVKDKNGGFCIRTRLPQKIICGTLNLIGILHILSEFKISFPLLVSSRSPLKYFQFLRTFFAFWFQILTLKRFWFNQSEILQLVNSTSQQCKMLPCINLKILRKNFTRLLCLIFAVMALYEIIWKKVFAEYGTWHETIWNRKLVSEGRFMLFLSENNTSLPPDPYVLSFQDRCLAFFVAVGWIERYIIGYYIDLSLLVIVLTVWSTTYTFAKTLEEDSDMNFKKFHALSSLLPPHIPPLIKLPSKMVPERSSKCNWHNVYYTYQSIREFCHLINSFWGTLVTIYLADAVLFYSLSVDNVFILTEITTKIRLLFFISNSTCVCLLSADACHQMDALKLWLTDEENRRHVPMDQLNVVLSELQYQTVGIRGSNVFTITYSLLWNVMTTVVTYFIICLQTRLQENHISLEMSAYANCTKQF